ncbi:MAG: hypothetical protein JXR03_08165 [Cyclobacteriaceae bacterium]
MDLIKIKLGNTLIGIWLLSVLGMLHYSFLALPLLFSLEIDTFQPINLLLFGDSTIINDNSENQYAQGNYTYYVDLVNIIVPFFEYLSATLSLVVVQKLIKFKGKPVPFKHPSAHLEN